MTDPMKTIFRKGTQPSDTDWWVVWHKYLDVARTPVIEDEHDRMYWSGAELDFPRYAPWAKIFSEWGKGDGRGGTLYCDGPSWRLGVPPPATAPEARGGSAAAVQTVAREYILTWFSPSSGESCASTAISVTANVGYPVKFEDLPDDPPEGVTYLYGYRRNGTTGEYKFVGKIPAGQTSATDNVEDGALGSVINPALLTCSLGSYAAPTAVPTTVITGPGPQTTYYYTWALYQKISTYDENTEQNYGPGLHGWLLAGSGSLPSVATDSTQTVTVTLPRLGSGAYNYIPGAFAPTPPTSFNVTTQAQYEWVILRSTTWSPSNTNYNGFEVVAREAPKLATDSSAHTIVIPARGASTTYNPPVSAFPIIYPYTVNTSAQWLTLLASTGSSLAGVPGKMYTYTYTIGTETIRSADSNTVRINDGDEVTVTLPTAPGGATSVNIYRRTLPPPEDPGYEAALTASASYKLLVTQAAGTTVYVDTTLDSALGANIPVASLVVQYAAPDVTGSGATAQAEAPPDEIPETRLYVYTYVTAYGEEGPPSLVSNSIDVFPGASVELVGMLGNPNIEWYNMQSKRIYRSSTGTNLTTLQFVAEIPINQSTYTDTLPGSELGEVISSTYYFPPPETCTGMRLMANGIMVMFDGKTLYPSEAYLPHAYDPNNYLTTEHEIVGLEVFGQSLAVLTTGYPYVLTGTDPSALSLTRLPVPQACSSKRSGVSTGDGALYASPDGMMLISPGGVRNLTEMLLNRDQWQAYNPFTMHSYVYNNYVFVFHDTGCIMFNFSGAAAIMAEIDELAIAGFYDAVQDALFYSKPDGIYKWDAGDLVPYTWRSKIFQITRPHNFGWGQVEADTYPLMFRVYNGLSTDPLYSYEVQGREPFRLPAGSIHRDWYVQLEGTATVFQVQIADDQAELKEV